MTAPTDSNAGLNRMLQYRPLRRHVRPARVATRIRRLDSGWEHMAFRMLENMSMTWGGAGNVLVPVDDVGEVHPDLWRLVELYDADRWAAYVQTWRGLQMEDPDGFHASIETQARSWARKHGGGVKRARESLTADHMMTEPLGGWSPPDAFTTRIRRWTSPEIDHGHLTFATYKADGEAGHQLTDVRDLAPLPETVRVLETGGLPLSLQVLIAMRTGALAPSHSQALTDRGVQVESVPIDPDDLERILMLAWKGANAFDSWGLQQAIARHLGASAQDEPPYASPSFLDATPLALSRLGCGQFSRFFPGRDDIPPVIVAGSHADDFAYALCLDRCGVPALWLPGEFVSRTDKTSQLVREALTRSLGEHRGQPSKIPAQLCSLSISTKRLLSLQQRLAKTHWGPHAPIEVGASIELPPYRVPALLDPETFDDPLDVPFDGEEMASGFPVVTPSAVRSDDPWKLTWWVDVEAVDHVVAPRSALQELSVASSNGWGATARFSRTGVAFFSHSMGFVAAGSSLRQMLDRPRLRFPSAFAIFDKLASDAGYSIAESPSGHFRRLSIELWGGLDQMAADLAHAPTRHMLEAWLSDAPSGKTPGVRTGARRRFLNIDDASTASGQAPPVVRPVLDRYIEAGILRRGLVLQCSHCRLFEWYELGAIRQTFDCTRCRTRNPVVETAWKGLGDEPRFYYDLTEVVFQALSGNAQVPVAAMASLKRGSRSFLHLSEVEILDQTGKPILELDLAAIIDGRIVVGEAKSGSHIGKSSASGLKWLRKLAEIAEALTADEIVFATAASKWAQVTKDNIATAFRNSHAQTRLLEGL